MGAKIEGAKGFGWGFLKMFPALVIYPVAGVLSIFSDFNKKSFKEMPHFKRAIQPGGRLVAMLWGAVHGLYRALLFPFHQARRGYKISKETVSREEMFGFKDVAWRVFQGSPFRRYLQVDESRGLSAGNMPQEDTEEDLSTSHGGEGEGHDKQNAAQDAPAQDSPKPTGYFSKISVPATAALMLSEFVEQVILSPLTFLTAVWDNAKRGWNEARWGNKHPRPDDFDQIQGGRFKSIGNALWGGVKGLFIGALNVAKAVFVAPIIVAKACRAKAPYYGDNASRIEGMVLPRSIVPSPATGERSDNYVRALTCFKYRKLAVATQERQSVSLESQKDKLRNGFKTPKPQGVMS